jgi:hypothetical protein
MPSAPIFKLQIGDREIQIARSPTGRYYGALDFQIGWSTRDGVGKRAGFSMGLDEAKELGRALLEAVEMVERAPDAHGWSPDAAKQYERRHHDDAPPEAAHVRRPGPKSFTSMRDRHGFAGDR